MAKKRKKVLCPNCKKKVTYASQHCRGKDELNAYWICKKQESQESVDPSLPKCPRCDVGVVKIVKEMNEPTLFYHPDGTVHEDLLKDLRRL